MSELQTKRFDVRIVAVYEGDTFPLPHDNFLALAATQLLQPTASGAKFLYHVALYTERDE